MAFAVEDRAMGKGREVEIAAELAIDADQYVEIEAGGDAGGIVIGIVKRALVLFEVDAEHHPRIAAQDLTGAAHERAGFVRLEIPDGRSREEADLRQIGDLGRQGERRGEVRRDRVNCKRWKIPAQLLRLCLHEIAGNVDGNVGGKRAALKQPPDFRRGACAKFDQRRAGRDRRRNRLAAIAQDRKLGARRIVFGKLRDLLEQLGACGVVEIFRRQVLGMLRQSVDDIVRKDRGFLVELVRFGQSGGVHIHDTLLNALFRAPLTSA